MITEIATLLLLLTLGVFSYDTVLLRFPDGVFPEADLYDLLRDIRPTDNGLKGWLDNAYVLISTAGMLISVSLPTYRYGSNAYALLLHEVGATLESICLRLGISPAVLSATHVYRVDVGVNLALRHRIAAYVGVCVEVQRASRLPFNRTGVVFKNTLRELALYDKVKQLAEKGGDIPAEWIEHDLNVGRFEVRFMRQLKREFGRSIYATDLSDPFFFADVVRRCSERFGHIRLNRELEVPPFTGSKEFWDWVAMRGIYDCVGEARCFELIDDARKAEQLSSPQASRLRKKIRETASNPLYTSENDLAAELNAAIDSAVDGTLALLD